MKNRGWLIQQVYQLIQYTKLVENQNYYGSGRTRQRVPSVQIYEGIPRLSDQDPYLPHKVVDKLHEDRADVFESIVAKSVTSIPRLTSPSVSKDVTNSHGPYCFGGVLQAIGDNIAILI